MAIQLRDYQSQLMADLSGALRQGCRRVVGTMATGSGKGTVAAAIAATAAERGHRVLLLAHRRELVEDLAGRIGAAGIRHGVIAPWRSADFSAAVQVASVDTIGRRLARVPAPSLIIQDEAHHLIEGNKWGRVIEAWPQAFLIGLTATPQRLSGEGLGIGHGGYFERLILGPSPQWLTDQGFLCRARVLAPPPAADLSSIRSFDTATGKARAADAMMARQAIGDAVGYYRRLIAPIHNGTALGFCVSVAHAEALVDVYRTAGISAASVDGKTDPTVRRQLIRDLGDGTLKMLLNCELIGEGTDIPGVVGVQQFRPTESLSMHKQQQGRALRICPGKSHAVIIDHVGNTNRFHVGGLPTDDVPWTLEGRAGKRTGERPISVRVCVQCFAACRSGVITCPECGHQFTPERREIEHVEGELRELQARQARRVEQSSARTLADLVAIGKARGMQRPHAWARHVMAAREAKRSRSGPVRVVA